MQKILLVEDDQFLRDIYFQVLTPLFEVDTAEDGKVAYDKISKNPYDLILLDMFLPKLDGKLVFEKLQKNFPEQYKRKIIFMSNDDSEQTINYLKKAGLRHFIKSNLNPGEFLDRVKSYIV